MGHLLGLLHHLGQACAEALGVFFNQQTVDTVGDSLCGAAACNQHSPQGAGSRLPHHQPVGDLPLGKVSQARIAAATQGYDLPEGLPLFLFVGRIMWYKGLRIIGRAMAGEKGIPAV